MIDSHLRKWLENAIGQLQPWIDRRSYRPLLLLATVMLAASLGRPLFETLVALYYSVPVGIRWSLGEAVVFSIIAAGLWRLCKVKPGDAWPIPASGQLGTRSVNGARWVPWLLRLSVMSLLLPIMRHPDGLGFADWDFVLDKFEALQRTVLVWGQFPWWDPWCRGGIPLAAEPQIGAVSIATPLVLLLGTSVGLRVSAILCQWIAVEGAYKLAWLWLREPWAAAAAALVYGLNGAVMVDTAQGYVTVMSYASVPWLAYHAFRIGDRFADGLALGFWLAFTVCNGIHYLSLYGGLLMVIVGLRALRVLPHRDRARALYHSALAIGLFLALSGWRLATTFLVFLDDRRERMMSWNESLASAFGHLLARPAPDWNTALPGSSFASYTGLVSYVGPVIVALALASLYWGWRWWHTLALVSGWLAIGSIRWYHPSYWLAFWPFFSSAQVVTRWRFLAFLGIGLAAGSVLARLRKSDSQWHRFVAVGLTIVVAVDLFSVGYEQLPLAFSVRPEARFFPGPAVATIVNVRDGLGYPCVQRGYGVIRGYEPMLSYRRDAPTLRKARDDPDYRGEAWTTHGPVEPTAWSPNRVVFEVDPGQEMFMNQNPGSWWWANGRPAFIGCRCAEPTVPFVARADAAGRLELEIRPPGLLTGIVLQGIGLVLIAVSLSRAWPIVPGDWHPVCNRACITRSGLPLSSLIGACSPRDQKADRTTRLSPSRSGQECARTQHGVVKLACVAGIAHEGSYSIRTSFMLGTILLVVLILLLIGALPTWPYSRNWGYYPGGGLGLVVLILIILLLMGRI